MLIRIVVALSRSTNKCFPFFQALKGNDKINWDSECEEAFQDLKNVSSEPALLSKPFTGGSTVCIPGSV